MSTEEAPSALDVGELTISEGESDQRFNLEEQAYLLGIEDEGEELEGEEPFSYFDLLDRPRILPEPSVLTFEHLKQISYELGLIKLCWPKITDSVCEDRANYPETYLNNTNKEKLLLLYTENFRQQFCCKHPHRNPLFLACENECGMQKMVCTTIRPTTLPYNELQYWEDLVKFVGDHLKYEPLEEPTLLPRRLCSPHTLFLQQGGHSFEIATALCSLLLGLGYDAYVVSGYAIKDVTLRIMTRVDSPYPLVYEEEEVKVEEEVHEKYKLRPPKDLRSHFLLMMEQREKDKVKAEEEKLAEIERQRILEEEQRPLDELEGLRVHAWVLLRAGVKDIKETVFIESSSGLIHPVDSPLYCGIESVWNNLNYWVNMQDYSKGQEHLEYDLTDTTKWEHLLIGEPIHWRKHKPKDLGEDDEGLNEMFDEKHLDMPLSWSMPINIPHDVLKTRFPEGARIQMFKRTWVEEFAPYVSDDGLVTRISRYKDFDCTEMLSSEERFENRVDKLYKTIHDMNTNLITDFHSRGREDKVIKHIYYKNQDSEEADRTIIYHSKGRYDSLAKIEVRSDTLTEYYENREDKMYYRQTTYTKTAELKKDNKPASNRRPILKIVQKFSRNEEKKADEDIAMRTFALVDREIHLKYHYGKGHVTASTRTFIKPRLAEMGEGMIFRPELTYGYQAEIGSKPPRRQKLYLLFEEQLKEEQIVINSIREIENQVAEFLMQRAHELAFPKLDVSLFNKEQNTEYKLAMLEREEQQRMYKEKEVEEEVNYLAPYMARLRYPEHLTYQEAIDIKNNCLEDFKHMLVNRANVIQKTFELMSEKLHTEQAWYTIHHDSLSPDEEASYFEKVNNLIFYLRTLEIRLTRLKDTSSQRYLAMQKYLDNHPVLNAVLSAVVL